MAKLSGTMKKRSFFFCTIIVKPPTPVRREG